MPGMEGKKNYVDRSRSPSRRSSVVPLINEGNSSLKLRKQAAFNAARNTSQIRESSKGSDEQDNSVRDFRHLGIY